jgi:hypothetical protein
MKKPSTPVEGDDEVPPKDYNRLDVKVNGQLLEAAPLDEMLNIGDVSSGMSTAPAMVAYWGHVWASSEAEKIELEASFKSWRARRGEELLAGDNKISEWKKDQAIEGDDMYLHYQKALATAERNVLVLRAVYEAFRTKASLLQSRAAMMRVELEVQGMSSPSGPPEAVRESRVSAMKAANANRKSRAATTTEE